MTVHWIEWDKPEEYQKRALQKINDGATGTEYDQAVNTAKVMNDLIEPPKVSTNPELMAAWEATMPNNHRPYAGKPPRDIDD